MVAGLPQRPILHLTNEGSPLFYVKFLETFYNFKKGKKEIKEIFRIDIRLRKGKKVVKSALAGFSTHFGFICLNGILIRGYSS